MLDPHDHSAVVTRCRLILISLGAALLAVPAISFSQNVSVSVVADSPTGAAIGVGFRWVLEEDATYEPIKGQPVEESHSLNLHRSYMPVVASGHSDSSSTTIAIPDSSKRYYVSVLPDADFTMSGKQMAAGQSSVQVVVVSQPVPTAQVFVRAFEDNAPINNVWDTGELGLGGFTVFIYDNAGALLTDVYGNPLGTVYDGLDSEGAPRVKHLGDGTLHTMTAEEAADPVRNPYGLEVGEALIKNIAPAKYGVRVVPSYMPPGEEWQQTSTIEGTPGQDVWVKAGEPRFFAEFGPAGHHAEYGFVRRQNFAPFEGTGSASISGTVVNLHMARPPDYTFSDGEPLANCWIGLNDATGTVGLHVEPCDGDSNFSIDGIPGGTYQLVVWDTYLDLIFNIQTVTVEDGEALADLNVATFRWFGRLESFIYHDLDGDGLRDEGEPGLPELALNFRYRDGSIYHANVTDLDGAYPFEEQFPFFSWLVAESDYGRFKPTGLTVTVDNGGPVDTGSIGGGVLNPQYQDPLDGGTNCTGPSGACLTRTELGTALTEGYNLFIGQDTRFEWGRRPYEVEADKAPVGNFPGPEDIDANGNGTLEPSVFENGGISGVVYYAITRAENDPRFGAAETWEPGIPRVQVSLYRANSAGTIDDGADNLLQLADVDNYPFCWSDPDFVAEHDGGLGEDSACPTGALTRGDEDEVKGGNGTAWSAGDAIEVAHTDSWDDNIPTGCRPASADPAGTDAFYYDGKCYDGLRNFNQARPAVFDGGYGFGMPFSDQFLAPGFYVIEANPPPGYEILKEEDKNVDFGDAFTLNPLFLPPVCVGDVHTVDDELALFPGVETVAGGEPRPYCDRKLVQHSDAKNSAADFFMLTEAPVTGHIQGFVLNDTANEFDPFNVNFGEKFAPSYIPVSIRDFRGNELYHTTTDAYGRYNAIVPSTYTMNIPMASGVSPGMHQVCLNSPTREDPVNPGEFIPDPDFNNQYTQFCYTFNFSPGTTTYLDTPVLPVAAFTGPNNWQLDAEFPNFTPVIQSVNVGPTGSNSGPYVAPGATGTGRRIEIRAVGNNGIVMVPDPSATRVDGNNSTLVQRDFGFGATPGTITIGGTALTVPAGGWTTGMITAQIPAGVSTGQLRITRTVSGVTRATVNAVTVIVAPTGSAAPSRVNLAGTGGAFRSIQAAIDATPAGGIVLVAPGVYNESVIITRPVQLQGAGAASTIINASQSPTDRIARWREKVNYLANCTNEIGLISVGQENNVPSPNGPCGFTPGTGLFLNEEGAGIFVAPAPGAFSATNVARIDGFTVTGADQSGGIVVNGFADYLEVSNNRVANNQSTVGAGGIRIGPPSLLDDVENWADASNDYVNIHNNHVTQNGSLFEPGGGIGIYTGADNYRATSNWVSGNFAQGDGGGIAHYGLSDGGLIGDNTIVFNQTFDQTAGVGGNGGGLLIAGHEPLTGADVTVSPGSGDVTVLRNLIQGNNAGTGDGGGIALRSTNGAEILGGGAGALLAYAARYQVDILNNTIVNNVAGLAAGGVAMQDATRVTIVSNTIANNDSTATAAAAFCAAADPGESCPQPAGVVARAHSAVLLDAVSSGVAELLGIFPTPGIGPLAQLTLVNNVVLANRSLYWSTTAGPTPTGFSAGVLLPLAPVYDDFGVLPEGTGTLTGLSNLVTIGADINAQTIPPTAGDLGTQATVFVNPYRNQAPAGTVVPGGEFPIAAAAALDEGGNYIDVHYGPLSLYSSFSPLTLSNYHLRTATPNPARNTGPSNLVFGLLSNVSRDIDQEPRPRDGGLLARFDVGSDEIQAGSSATGGNDAPVIVNPASGSSLVAYQGVPLSYQVLALDVNGDPLTYGLTRSGGGGVPAGLTIDSKGVIKWPSPPAPSGGAASETLNGFSANANDGRGGTDSNTFSITLRTANAPGASPDGPYQIISSGQVTVPAPGVLANDAPVPNQAQFGTRVARLVSNLSQGGTVALVADGGFTYSPAQSFVGTATFTYEAVNNAGSSGATLVTLSRPIAVTDARYFAGAGTWNLSGFAVSPGETLQIAQVPGGVVCGALGLPDCPIAAADGSWSFVVPGASPDGTTFTITSPSGQVLGVVLQNVNATNGAPLSTSYVQCPGDTNGDAIPDEPGTPANVTCRHLAAGDGFARMADGTELYGFGFNDVTGIPANLVAAKGILNAHYPAPTLEFNEGDEAYITLTNVGMLLRPDLFDPHSIHFHGFPNAATVFDGVPESSISVNMGFSLTYYYNIVEPGTFMYHCHVEATEHMQMGMLGNLYVHPAQNGESLGGFERFVYNDGDGTTGYDVEYPIQIGSFDSTFHNQSHDVQPLRFAEMRDDYQLLNGRGYPDTVLTDVDGLPVVPDGEKAGSGVTSANESSQVVSSLISATQGQRILLRISNLNVTQFYTLATTGLTMQVVGTGAHILRGPDGDDLYYETSSVTLGGGESADVLIDTTNVAPGTYLLYSTNLNELSNGAEDFGGMMTEIVISAP